MPEATHKPGRFLAPLALVIVAVAFFAILLSSTAGDDGDDGGSRAAEATDTDTSPASTERPRPQRRNYTVKLGDSLGAISEKTGVEVERLQELNPDLDPQALEIGQRIKLRE
jgi:LysM repeat protein